MRLKKKHKIQYSTSFYSACKHPFVLHHFDIFDKKIIKSKKSMICNYGKLNNYLRGIFVG